jgi:hypothetical protein
VVTYIDDCTAYGNDFDTHYKDLSNIFDRLWKVNMTLNANKCSLFCNQIELLGFKISKSGVNPLPEKVARIMDFPRSINETGICAFVNMAEFYRNHIPIYTELVNPLLELLKKKNAFQWSKEYEMAFKTANQAITKSATLGFPDPQLKFHLFCDASEIGIGAALTQIINGTHVPVCFISRKFQDAEIKYATVEKELLSVVYSVAKFHKCLLDKPF